MEALLKAGHPPSEIATVLKRHKSTISREFRRNRGLRGYRPKQVQRSPPHPTTNKHQNNAEGHRFRLPVHHQYSILPLSTNMTATSAPARSRCCKSDWLSGQEII
ncbi:MAG: hypothetical protein CL923_07650 [Deltaproteobacteria bacterium]|nr:hypothetical protein [Deltaproteobacteria bacterium]MBQ32413.1 hypothetical protein [Deltaproteobacteria bacterium]